MEKHPLVFIATPVYNGARFLSECIESIINQTYSNWRYVIVNNCSNDATADIAARYAERDPRISLINNEAFVGSIENHNIAVRHMPPESKYCKIVSADDWLFPECLARMIELAEAHPSVGIIGSYQLSGNGDAWKVRWDEIKHPSSVVAGREICRSQLLGGPYVFGTPTSCLYRADLVMSRNPFFPHNLPHADTSACYECFEESDFGFVHQVLSFERIHADSITAGCKYNHTEESVILRNLLSYGPVYLSKDEFEKRLEEVLRDYYRSLAVGFFNVAGAEYWRFHYHDLAELGYKCFGLRFAKAVIYKFMDLLLNPKLAIEKILRRKALAPISKKFDSSDSRATPRAGAKIASHFVDGSQVR